ncbi:MAG: hypothetical protein IJV54_04365 [Bacteroidales bacterium]|nr:hypothetical protein [Bacteroidales bacterium]
MMFQVSSTEDGYIVEAYMPDRDGLPRWTPLRNFGEHQGDAKDFCEMDCPRYPEAMIRGLAKTFDPDRKYWRTGSMRLHCCESSPDERAVFDSRKGPPRE